MKKIKEYRQGIINILILSIISISLYYIAKSALDIWVRVLLGVALLGFFFKVFLKFKGFFYKN